MANDPMQLLLDEHEVISKAKEAVDALERAWTRSEQAYEEAVGELLTFFAKYSDGFHHRKEELVLFPTLKSHPDFYTQDMLTELEDHHQAFRDHLAQIRFALDGKNHEAAQSRLRAYLNELLDHIAIENDELFVMTGSLLSDAELERMYFRFKDVDHELGEDLKKELEGTVANVTSSAGIMASHDAGEAAAADIRRG